MIDITTLKKGDKFYLVDLDYNICDEDAVVECIVIKRYLKTKKCILIDALQYVDCTPPEIVVDNGEEYYVKLTKELEQYMYLNLEDALNHHNEYKRIYYLGMNACNRNMDVDWYELGKAINEKYKDYPSCFGSDMVEDDDEICKECEYRYKCEEKLEAYYIAIGNEVLSQLGEID